LEESTDQQNQKSKRFLKIAVVSAFVFAVTWGLPGFFNWLFFSATVYLFFLSWYNKPKVRQEPEYNRYQGEEQHDPVERVRNRAKRMAVIVAIFVFGLFFFFFLIGLFVTDDTSAVTVGEDFANEDRATLAQNPNDLNALTNIGNQFFENSEYDSAAIYYNRILVLDRQNSAALYNMGIIYYNQQQYQKSIDVLKQCVQAHPENGDAYYILGHDYYDQQQQNEAFIWYTKAYENGIQGSFISHVLAYLHDNKGNTTRAIQLYKEAVQQDSSKTEIYTRLAELEPGNAARYTQLAERWKTNQ
jgi:tetratricopeptide (TPR) repeat protein